MKVKTKLLLGVGALFLMIVLLTVIGSLNIHNSKQDTQKILVANYKSLEYAKNMILALDNPDTTQGNKIFSENLKKEAENITEKNERETVQLLSQNYAAYQAQPDAQKAQAIRENIGEIMHLNMLAIQRKSDTAIHTSQNAYYWILSLGAFCFLVALYLLISIPASIARPVEVLTTGIRSISQKDYTARIDRPLAGEFGEMANAFNVMAEKLEAYESSNHSEKLIQNKRLETLINNMHDPLIGIDEEGKLILVNEEAVKIFGFVKEDILHKDAESLAQENDLFRELRLRAGSTTDSLRIYYNDKENYYDPEVLPVHIRKAGEKGIYQAGQFFILRNITRYKELDSAKTNFIATISHELKIPISAIKMGIRLLENEKFGNLNEQQKELLTGVQEDTDRLLQITAELLNMSQAESGSMILRMGKFKVSDLLEAAEKQTLRLAGDKNIRIHTENATPEGQSINGDEDKLLWVLSNFLSNAVKYAPQDSTVTLSAVQDGARVRFAVSDKGPGIEPQYQDKVFERYFKIPGSQAGTGLGLAISRHFIQKMNGEIGVESTPGAGSTFWFEVTV